MAGALFIGPKWLGDFVMSIPMLRILEQRYGQVDCVLPSYLEPIFHRAGIEGSIKVLDIVSGEWGWAKRRQLANKIKPLDKEVAIVLPGSYKSALLPWMANIPRRVGYLGEFRYGLLNDIRSNASTRKIKTPYIQQYASLAIEKDEKLEGFDLVPRLRIDLSEQKKTLEKYNLLSLKKGKRLVICPGAANGKSKRWRSNYIIQLAKTAFSSGWEVWLMGGKVDVEFVQPMLAYLPFIQNLVGKTTLPEAIDLLGTSDVVVANDSGLMHVASALNKPVVAIYGSTHPHWASPQSDHHAIMYADLECQPCMKKTCPLKHHHCMTNILPERVFETIEDLYQREYSNC
ncbi:MAG TPA: lipopolysaccharide heptosyltransferase II [Gammaproteobacteria bacterium]|nr:lipopolysaccharide heptosyltransferase II [Gammaproteobacteria bacterium]